jgi:hypothetical protein
MARKPREKIEVVETHVGEPALLMGWPKRTGVVSEDVVALHPCRSGCPAAESERSGVGGPILILASVPNGRGKMEGGQSCISSGVLRTTAMIG